jgi:adenylate cyclase
VGAIRLFAGDYQGSEYHHTRALELNPNDAYLVARTAVHYLATGKFDRALELVRQAMRQDPFLPDWCREEEVVALYLLDRHAEAHRALKGLSQASRRALAYGVANLACLDATAEREATVAELLRIDPEFTAARFVKSEPKFADHAIAEKIERDLTTAGLGDSANIPASNQELTG